MDPSGQNRTGQSFGFQNPNSINMNSNTATDPQATETPRLNAIPIPQDMPFSSTNPTSFAQISSNIAQPITSATSLSANIYSHTLSQYGPAIVEQQQPDSPILRPQCITTPAIVSRPMGGIEINPQYNFVGLNDNRPALPAAATTNSNALLFSRPATITTNSCPAPQTAAAAVLNINRANEPSRSELVYSPPPMERDDNMVINPNSGRPMGPDGRIPKKMNDKVPLETTDTLLDLQKLYRTYDDQLRSEKSARDRVDHDINSMTRGHRGQSIELDPIYCKMKDQKKWHESEMDRLESELKKVDAKMIAKFNYRMTRQNDSADQIFHIGQSGKRQLAKMSTATTYESKNKDKNMDKKDISLALADTNTWCDICDLHFTNLRDLARHWHTPDHRSRSKKSTPWQTHVNPQSYDKNKTYQTMKSICSKLTNENDRNFTINDIDKALNPIFDPKDPDMRARFLARERGRFEDDDPLFKVRGYDQIMPILGYYCKLCSRPLCDALELEKHLMSYEHTYSHLKSISLNPDHERKKRSEFIKSYQKEFPTVEEDDAVQTRRKEKHLSEDKHKDKPTQQAPTQAAPRGYKKLTSSIVDDHEALQGLLPPARRPPSSLSADETTKNADNDKSSSKIGDVGSSPNKRRRYQTSVPEIEPLNKNQATGALKRLKNGSQTAKFTSEILSKKTNDHITTIDLDSITSLSDYDEPMDEIPARIDSRVTKRTKTSKKSELGLNKSVVLEPGDEDSPFPDLKLSLSVNAHDEILKDKRLKQHCVVKLSMINLDDYKDMLMDTSTRWTRIDQLMAKREKIKSSDVVTRTQTEPTFFSLDGQRIPVELEDLANSNKMNSDGIDNRSIVKPLSNIMVEKIEKISMHGTSYTKQDELERGDNGSDAVGEQARKERKVHKNEVMFTDEENEEEKPVDVDNYMTTLTNFFLEKQD